MAEHRKIPLLCQLFLSSLFVPPAKVVSRGLLDAGSSPIRDDIFICLVAGVIISQLSARTRHARPQKNEIFRLLVPPTKKRNGLSYMDEDCQLKCFI